MLVGGTLGVLARVPLTIQGCEAVCTNYPPIEWKATTYAPNYV